MGNFKLILNDTNKTSTVLRREFLSSKIFKIFKIVFFLGLESHPQHELAKKQASGFGGMVSFVINGNLETSKKFFKNTKVKF